MISIHEYTLHELFAQAVNTYGTTRMCGMIDDPGFTYEQWGEQVLALRDVLIASGTYPGQRIALLGENSPQWGMAYFASVAAQAVAVPILNDFHAKEVQHILEHSGAEVLFVSRKQHQKVGGFAENSGHRVYILEDIAENAPVSSEKTLQEQLNTLPEVDPDQLASIIYTSGTTGMSKGVMLSHRNIVSNAETSARSFISLEPGERMLSILPLSHAYEFTIGFILGMIAGLDTYYLGKPPTAGILIPAMQSIRPQIMLSVPLLIEKVYKNSVKKQIQNKALLRTLSRFGPARRMIHRKAGKQLVEKFGGNLRFFGIGGAPLDWEVEQFLIEARFPYAIGYGLTETAPLIVGCAPSWVRLSSAGKVLDGVDLRIADPRPDTQIGEIQVKGPNVMGGYYQNEEATREAFTEDGWLKTGDLGFVDADGYVFLKGREKSMILGANGENIYPESIESLINSYDFVEESLVLPSREGLVARVKLDLDGLSEHMKTSADQIGGKAKEYADSLISRVNKELNIHSRVRKIKLAVEPFVRTPTKKIKRFLYQEEDE